MEVSVWTIGTSSTGEQNILHILDGNSRIAARRLGDDLGDTTPAVKFNLEDHLGSSNLSLSTDGAVVSGEEYYPFGETSFGSYGKKRYRFCGKERDEESGLYYYGMRYYSAWTCRFVSVDPLAGKYPFFSPYCYANCNPVMMNDPTGGSAEGIPEGEQKTNNPNPSTQSDSTDNSEVKTDSIEPSSNNDQLNDIDLKINSIKQSKKDGVTTYKIEAEAKVTLKIVNLSNKQLSQTELDNFASVLSTEAQKTFSGQGVNDTYSALLPDGKTAKTQDEMIKVRFETNVTFKFDVQVVNSLDKIG